MLTRDLCVEKNILWWNCDETAEDCLKMWPYRLKSVITLCVINQLCSPLLFMFRQNFFQSIFLNQLCLIFFWMASSSLHVLGNWHYQVLWKASVKFGELGSMTAFSIVVTNYITACNSMLLLFWAYCDHCQLPPTACLIAKRV